MIFVYNALFVLLLGKLFEKKIHSDKNKRKFLFITFVQMVLIQGLRATDVGTDTEMYVTVYNNYLSSKYYSFLFTHFEPGFQEFYNILHSIRLDSQWMLFIVSAITLFLFAIFIYNNSNNVVLSTFIFACLIYPNSFNIMRQALGLSIAINSLQYLLKQKYIKAVILIIISSFFHATSILMLIPFILSLVKRNWKLVRNVILLSSVVFLLFGNQIINVLLLMVGKSFYLSGYNVTRLFRMTSMLTFVIAFISWYFLNNTLPQNNYRKQLNLFSCISFVNMVCGILYLRFEFFSRIIEYFNAFLIIAIPIWITVGKRKYEQLYRMGFCIVAFLIMLNSVFNSGSGIGSYRFFFS